jgi:hypothetical protein
MPFINYSKKEIEFKIVYYGPAFAGKKTNLNYIYMKTATTDRGKFITLDNETDKTVFFDMFATNLGEVMRSYKTRLVLHTLTGICSDEGRKKILQNVDGIVFVADSQINQAQANKNTLNNLLANLTEYGYTLDKVPIVFQYNKRDLPEISTVEELNTLLNPQTRAFESVALNGTGASESLKSLTSSMISVFKKGG